MAASPSSVMTVIADVANLLRELMRAGGLSARAVTPPVAAPVVAPVALNGAAISRGPSRVSSPVVTRQGIAEPLLGAGASVESFFGKASWSGATADVMPLPGTSQSRVSVELLTGLVPTAGAGLAGMGAELQARTVAAFFRPVDWSGQAVPVALPAAAMAGGQMPTVDQADLFAYPVHQFFSRVGWSGAAMVAMGTANGHSGMNGSNGHSAPPEPVAVPSKRRETGTAKEVFGEFSF